jgi:hypothetical protein
MTKFFTNLPDNLEQYNPTVPLEKRYWKETFESSCATLNDSGRLHSYDGKPSRISFSKAQNMFQLIWHKNGKIHREGDLPATIRYQADGKLIHEEYYINGFEHRGNGLPCEISPGSNAWMIHGVLHNPSGAADINIELNIRSYGLYGVQIPYEIFDEIIKYKEAWGDPLWVAFLLILKIIDFEQVEACRDYSGFWSSELPTSWILHAWNLNAASFGKKIEEFTDQNQGVSCYSFPALSTYFEDFLNVIKFEEEEALLRSARENKDINA